MSNLYDAHLVNERVEFKIYSCKKHLVNLKQTKSTYENFHKSKHEVCQARINLELEIDCLISQMVSVIDCLLVQISNKLGLSIPLHQISIDRVVRRIPFEIERCYIGLNIALRKAFEIANLENTKISEKVAALQVILTTYDKMWEVISGRPVLKEVMTILRQNKNN